jgi:hypothetical protein
MALSGWDFKEYEHLLDDNLINQAIDILEQRYKKMADWIKENEGIDSCSNCKSNNLHFAHNGIECNECGHFEKVKVPYPSQGGTVASRKLESVIKELFSSKMQEQRKKEKPSEKQLERLPFEVDDFDSGEYTKEQVEYLTRRYSTLVEEDNIIKSTDKFYIRSLVIQELKIMTLERQQAIGMDISSTDIKRQYEIYNKLATKVKANKSSRGDEGQTDFLKDMEEKLDKREIKEIVDDYFTEDLQLRQEYLEMSKQRREEVGNPY